MHLSPLDDELQDISTLEYREETQHLNDQGPAVDQIDLGKVRVKQFLESAFRIPI